MNGLQWTAFPKITGLAMPRSTNNRYRALSFFCPKLNQDFVPGTFISLKSLALSLGWPFHFHPTATTATNKVTATWVRTLGTYST